MTDVPFSLLRLDHVVLRTADVERLVTFYEGLGCSVVRRLEQMDMTQLRAGGSMIEIIGTGGAAPSAEGKNLDHFAIRIEPFDRDTIVEYLSARGIEAQPMARLLGADGYGPAVYLSDPDGNRVELKGPPEAAAGEAGQRDSDE